MSSKTISTILNLKDNMSSGFVKVSKNINNMSKDAQKASKQVANMANNFKKKADEMSSKALKFAAVGASIAGAFALKTGLSEALNLEGYKLQLETATKDTKKAADIMSYAIDLANKTPFEGGELVEAASKFEAMGLSAKKYLPLVGDMASATNKPVDQAVEAMIDAQTGELERLKEFGITKALITEKSNQMFRNQTVINNKGQIVDQKKFNQALEAIMTDRFKGGMEKQSNSIKGLWSTVTGVTKSSLANFVGMMNDGTIKQGSLLDKLKSKVKQLSDTFSKWQTDGTIQRASQSFSDAFTKIYNIVSKVGNFILAHQKTFETFAVTIAGFMVAVKIALALKTAIMGLQVVWAIFNGTLVLSPFGWVVIGITALVTAGFALWRNWGTVSNNLALFWDGTKAVFADGVNWCIDKINWFIEKINKLPFINLPTISNIGYRTSTDNGKTSLAVQKSMDLGGNATGTQYWRGGRTKVNEHGGEIIDLPSGSKVIPADKSKQLLSDGKVIVYVTVQGNVIGNEEFADEVGGHVANKVLTVLQNM